MKFAHAIKKNGVVISTRYDFTIDSTKELTFFWMIFR